MMDVAEIVAPQLDLDGRPYAGFGQGARGGTLEDLARLHVEGTLESQA